MIARRTRIRHLQSRYESLRTPGVGFEQARTSWHEELRTGHVLYYPAAVS